MESNPEQLEAVSWLVEHAIACFVHGVAVTLPEPPARRYAQSEHVRMRRRLSARKRVAAGGRQ